MKGELKAGGLALVYGLQQDTHHNGKSVKLIGLESMASAIKHMMMIGDYGDGQPERWWRVTGLLPHNRVSKVKARNLMPIDDADPDAVESKQRDLVAQ